MALNLTLESVQSWEYTRVEKASSTKLNLFHHQDSDDDKDNESDDDLDDEAMMKLDDALSEVFKQHLKARDEKKNAKGTYSCDKMQVLLSTCMLAYSYSDNFLADK